MFKALCYKVTVFFNIVQLCIYDVSFIKVFMDQLYCLRHTLLAITIIVIYVINTFSSECFPFY